MSYINIQKGKIKLKCKFFLSFIKLVIFLLQFVSVDFEAIKNIRYLDHYETEISFLIQGEGNKLIMNNTFTPKPYRVLVNGYIDNSKVITINQTVLHKEENFVKTDDGYEMTFRIKKDYGIEARQKFLRCSELVRRPNLTKALISYKMDLYGNIKSVHYSLSAYGTKNLDGFGDFSAPIDIEIDQTYSYTNQNLIIPTVIEF